MIDWDFISTLEGHRLSGYVPDECGSDSGVTIADGVDLGRLGSATFDTLPIDLQALLRPYVGLRKADAAAALTARALIVTEAQADTLDAAVRAPIVLSLSARYFADAKTPFEELPARAQTVIASVTFQYGTPWQRCPKFWDCVAKLDWPGTVYELRNFGDAYPMRRNAEADYLETLI
ncbi:MAG: pesticin C-terminus-like muramidase [Rhizomicrobium sp.]|jgi:hypothetical protein